MSPLKIEQGSSRHSAYDLRDPNAELIERHTLAVIVDNEAGVLARVIGLFSGRGYNLESLTVAETDEGRALSRISIVTTGTPMVIEQIKAQLARLVPIHSVRDLTENDVTIERELALVKIINSREERIEALRLADSFRARTLDRRFLVRGSSMGSEGLA